MTSHRRWHKINKYKKFQMSFLKKRKLIRGKFHPSWKGDNVGYFGFHAHIKKHNKKSKFCQKCFTYTSKLNLCNIRNHNYTRNIEDYKWLCYRCHMIIDKRYKNLVQFKNKKFFSNPCGEFSSYSTMRKYIVKNIKKPKKCQICNINLSRLLLNIDKKYTHNFKKYKWVCHRCIMIHDGRFYTNLNQYKQNVTTKVRQ